MRAAHRGPGQLQTGEDLVRSFAMAGALVTAKFLEICLRAGTRGRPGEFTSAAYPCKNRSFPGGSLHRLIISRATDLALRSPRKQLGRTAGDEFAPASAINDLTRRRGGR